MEDHICDCHNLVQYGFTASYCGVRFSGRGRCRNDSSGLVFDWRWRIRGNYCRRDRNAVWKRGHYFGAGPGEQELVGRAVRMTSVVEPEQAIRNNSLLIPSIALGYVPFVIIVLMFYSRKSPDETLPGFEFLIFSSMCLVPLLPIYALYLFKIIRQRRGDNTLTTPVVIFYIISFTVPFYWLLMYAWFAINFNGIV